MMFGIAFLALALLCFAAATSSAPKARATWYACALALAVVACVRLWALDDAAARSIARYSFHHGWYENRRDFQGPVVAALLLVGVLALLVVRRRLVAQGALETVAGAATLVLVALSTVRTVSFHDADFLLGYDHDGLSPGVVIEALAVLCLGIVASLRVGQSWPMTFERRHFAAAAAGVAVLGLAFVPRESGLAAEQPLVAIDDASVALADGFAVAGTALAEGASGTLAYELPDGATILRAFLYWGGEHTGTSGDPTIVVDGEEIIGERFAGPTYFYTWFDRVNESAYRADVSGLVGNDGEELTVSGLDFEVPATGAGLLILYELPVTSGPIDVRQGLDLAFSGFKGSRHAIEPVVFPVEPSMVSREATVTLMLFAIDARTDGALRPSVIDIRAGDTERTYLDPLGRSADGWDLLTFDVTIPPQADSVTVDVRSEDRSGANLSPVSFALLFAGLEFDQ